MHKLTPMSWKKYISMSEGERKLTGIPISYIIPPNSVDKSIIVWPVPKKGWNTVIKRDLNTGLITASAEQSKPNNLNKA